MPKPHRGRRVSIAVPRGWPLVVLAALTVLAAVAGGGLGYFMRFDLPDVRKLEDYQPPVMTRVLASDGSLLDTFQEERRMLIDYGEIPVVFRQALLATEDAGFYRHTGIDFRGIARAAWRDLRSLRLAQGASTLTQQLARNLFLHPQKTIRRKLEEAVLALEIERQYTKEEILGFYCNQIYMGHGRYGLEAAARYYYGTPAHDLSLNQAATLAGLIQRPEALSPVRHPERTTDRRNYVLRRMADVGFLTPEEAAGTQAEEIVLEPPSGRGDLAPYFVEDIRRWLQARYGSESLYTEGLEVRSTLDPGLQEIANRAVELGLRELDKRQGWRGAVGRLPDDTDPAVWRSADWDTQLAAGDVLDALVLEVSESSARLRIGPLVGNLASGGAAWTGKNDLRELFSAGDIVRVALGDLADAETVAVTLEQEPAVEAALVALDPKSGAVRALVGGFDFARSEFNRATQAKRQTGSAFKPFVYAAALSAGLTLSDTLLDEPIVFLDPRKPEPYQPENYKNKYYGTITLRTALERSANIATVKLLDEIGYRRVIDTAHSLGIESELRAYPSLALGAFETTLVELTAAYGAFANGGVHVSPHLIDRVLDRDGRLVDVIEPSVRDAIRPETAHLMNRLLAGVITDGTGRGAAMLRLPLAGKTGTTDENTDAWFIGYSPELALGVWVGFDEPRTLGEKETGAMAALPIWRAFFEAAYADHAPPQPSAPPGIELVAVDRRTGLRANARAYCRPVIVEAFIQGTEPTEECSVYEHQKLRLPYFLQRFPLDERGALIVPEATLLALLEREANIRVADRGRRLEVSFPDEIVSIPLAVEPADLLELVTEAEPDPRLAEFEVETWVGKDGRPAEIVWIDGRARRARR